MKAGRKPQILTEKELVIMRMLWEHGPMFVREMLEIYPEPKPHFNTVSTIVRILEDKGHVGHEVFLPRHGIVAVGGRKTSERNRLPALSATISTIPIRMRCRPLWRKKKSRLTSCGRS